MYFVCFLSAFCYITLKFLTVELYSCCILSTDTVLTMFFFFFFEKKNLSSSLSCPQTHDPSLPQNIAITYVPHYAQ